MHYETLTGVKAEDVLQITKVNGHRKREEITCVYLKDGSRRFVDDYAVHVAEALKYDMKSIKSDQRYQSEQEENRRWEEYRRRGNS